MMSFLKLLSLFFWGVSFFLAFVMFWITVAAFYFLVRMFND